MIGYIVGVRPEGGLAAIEIARRPRGKASTTVYVDAGHGVRQIVSYFGSWDDMVASAPITRLRFETEGQILTGFTP